MFVFQFVSFVIYVVIAIVMKYTQHKMQQYKQQKKLDKFQLLNSRLTKVTYFKEIDLQFLMTISSFNIIPFLLYSFIFLKYSVNIIGEISSIILFSVVLFTYICTLVVFFCDPDPFDYFRYSFRREPLAMPYYWLYLLAIVSQTLLLLLIE